MCVCVCVVGGGLFWKEREGKVREKEERRFCCCAIVGVEMRKEKTKKNNAPLTLRNMPSIASAYEWSRNQIEGSRSSSSKGTESE